MRHAHDDRAAQRAIHAIQACDPMHPSQIRRLAIAGCMRTIADGSPVHGDEAVARAMQIVVGVSHG